MLTFLIKALNENNFVVVNAYVIIIWTINTKTINNVKKLNNFFINKVHIIIIHFNS
jgi:hypothetical protein